MLESEKLGLLVWSPLAGGLLSGKVTRQQASEAGTRRAAVPFPPVDQERAYNIIDALTALSKQKDASVAQLAIAWLLHQPAVSSVLLGTRRIEQLEDNLGAVAIELSPADLQSLDEVSQLPPAYPGWMLQFWSAERRNQLAAMRRNRF